jgi:pilus assembly protein Flp/PilA
MIGYLRIACLPYLKIDKRAVTAIEYALIAALIAVVIIGAVTNLGKGVSSTLSKVSGEL